MGITVKGGAGSLDSPAPPSAAMRMRRPSGVTWETETTTSAPATEHARESTKAQLKSITGRMFQV